MAHARVRLELNTAGLVLAGGRVGSAWIDASRAAENPGQPFAMWVPLRALAGTAGVAEEEAGGFGAAPLPQPRPVKSTFVWANAAAATAAADDAKSGAPAHDAEQHPAMRPVAPDVAAHEAESLGDELTTLSAVQPPADPAAACVLLQLCFCLRVEDKPRFALQAQPSEEGAAAASAATAGPAGGAAPHTPSRHLTQQPGGIAQAATPPSRAGDGGGGGALHLASPAAAESTSALVRQVTLLRRAFRALRTEKEAHEAAAQGWAAEREVLRAEIARLRASVEAGAAGGALAPEEAPHASETQPPPAAPANAEDAAAEAARAETVAAEEAERAEAGAETLRVSLQREAAEPSPKRAKRAIAEAEARTRAEAEARVRAEAEARTRTEAEARARAEAEARARAEAEARVRAEAEARARAEAEERARAEAEKERARQEHEARAAAAAAAEKARAAAAAEAARVAAAAAAAAQEARTRTQQQQQRPPSPPSDGDL
jgi:hypothetical protein